MLPAVLLQRQVILKAHWAAIVLPAEFHLQSPIFSNNGLNSYQYMCSYLQSKNRKSDDMLTEKVINTMWPSESTYYFLSWLLFIIIFEITQCVHISCGMLFASAYRINDHGGLPWPKMPGPLFFDPVQP